ncbi:winged helix-turn-helix transcriptional regulator [Erwinia amylovora]
MADLSGPFIAACPTRMLLDQLADKWSVLLLIAVSENPVRFNTLKRQIEGISQKMLGQTLRRLEMNGLVRREAFATVPVTVQYGITPLGASLVPIVDALRQWSVTHVAEILAARNSFAGEH